MKKEKEEPKNIKEFNALIKKYESITLEQIKKVWNGIQYPDGVDVAEILTGFGSMSTCTLCLGAGAEDRDGCYKCVYYRKRRDTYLFCCNTGRNLKTYSAIEEAMAPEDLWKAFRERAKFMRKTYSKYVKI